MGQSSATSAHAEDNFTSKRRSINGHLHLEGPSRVGVLGGPTGLSSFEMILPRGSMSVSSGQVLGGVGGV